MKTKSALTITLPSDLEIVMTRTFDAPRQLVFEAHSKPEHIRRWWGPRGSTLPVCEMDFRVGGAWRYVLRLPDGSEHPFKGEYREIARPEKLAYTFIYDVDLIRDHPALETIVFAERDGKTTTISTILHKTREARDGHLQSGLEEGAAETMHRLEEFLAVMA
jgi:uncharacterized protein YndB with AHSA1/START domain